jgi:hypothetical protein
MMMRISVEKPEHLTLKGQRSANLVAGLVELVGVEGQAEADGGAGVELGGVGEGRDAAVVDLGLDRKRKLRKRFPALENL